VDEADSQTVKTGSKSGMIGFKYKESGYPLNFSIRNINDYPNQSLYGESGTEIWDMTITSTVTVFNICGKVLWDIVEILFFLRGWGDSTV